MRASNVILRLNNMVYHLHPGLLSLILNVPFFKNKYYNLFGIPSTARSMFEIVFIAFKSLQNIMMIFYFILLFDAIDVIC